MSAINTGDEVSKTAVVNRFNEVMRSQINPIIDVGTSTSFSSGNYNQFTNVPSGGVPYASIGTPTVAPAVTSGLGSIVDAGDLATYLRNLTRDYSGVRITTYRYRFNRTGYPSGNGQQVISYRTTDYVHYDGAEYKQTVADNSSTYDVVEGNLIDASDFESYIADLYSQWNTLKNNRVTVFVDACHSSCHSNCHGSRGRR